MMGCSEGLVKSFTVTCAVRFYYVSVHVFSPFEDLFISVLDAMLRYSKHGV